MFALLDTLAALPILAWAFGLIHGPDARHAFLTFLLLSGGIQFYILKRKPDSWGWQMLTHFLEKLETSVKWRTGFFLLGAIASTVMCGLKALSGHFMAFDQGIFSQILWSLGHGQGFRSTIETPGNHLLVHFSPTLALSLPISAALNYHPLALVLTASLCLWGGGYAWLKIIQIHPMISGENRSKLEAGTVLILVFFDSIWANLQWGFHEAHLAFLFLSWAFYFILSEQTVMAILFLFFTALSKEAYLLDVSMLALALGFFGKKIRRAPYVLLSALCMVGFVIYGKWAKAQLAGLPSTFPRDYLTDLFSTYFGYLGVSNVKELIIEAIQHPFQIASLWWNQNGANGGALFPVFLLVTFGFAPILSLRTIHKQSIKQLALGATLIPSFFMILLSNNAKLSDYGLQYVLVLWPTLFVISLTGFQLKFFKVALAPLYLAIIINIWSGGLDYLKLSKASFREMLYRKDYLSALNQIKPNESVLTDDIGLQLANRMTIQSPPRLHFFTDLCPDWIVSEETKSTPTLALVKSNCNKVYKLTFSANGMDGWRVTP
jgi:hypothetical protein